MQSDMKGNKVVMKLEGVMAEVIIKIDHKLYTRFVTKEKGKNVVYVILTKALYGMLQAALLFWQNLLTETNWGFKTNPSILPHERNGGRLLHQAPSRRTFLQVWGSNHGSGPYGYYHWGPQECVR
jgi:hypothetical protein